MLQMSLLCGRVLGSLNGRLTLWRYSTWPQVRNGAPAHAACSVALPHLSACVCVCVCVLPIIDALV